MRYIFLTLMLLSLGLVGCANSIGDSARKAEIREDFPMLSGVNEWIRFVKTGQYHSDQELSPSNIQVSPRDSGIQAQKEFGETLVVYRLLYGRFDVWSKSDQAYISESLYLLADAVEDSQVDLADYRDADYISGQDYIIADAPFTVFKNDGSGKVITKRLYNTCVLYWQIEGVL